MALGLLALREHSRLEIERKLVDRGFAPDAVEQAIDRLTEEGALNESRLAERYVAERADKGFGPLRIRAELLEKGLTDSLIEPHLSAMAEEWPSRLAAVHERRFGASPPRDRAEFARRGRFLEQRGFAAEQIRRCLRWVD